MMKQIRLLYEEQLCWVGVSFAFVDDEIEEKLSKNCPNVMRNVEKMNSDLWIVLLLKRTLK